MFIFNLTYQKPIEEVEKFLNEHLAYLDKHYKSGNFICSGRKIPRTGGIILCRCGSEQEAQAIFEQDPFYANGIARYEVIEFVPTKHSDEFGKCL